MDLDHILVTTDLSPEALRPCAAIAGLARSSGARITLLHVVEDVRGRPHSAPLAPSLESPDLEERMAEARTKLEAQRPAFDGAQVTLDAVSGGDVAKAIARYATDHGAGLIAISTHGRTGFRHLVLGSVAEALLRHSPIPVLVFPRSD